MTYNAKEREFERDDCMWRAGCLLDAARVPRPKQGTVVAGAPCLPCRFCERYRPVEPVLESPLRCNLGLARDAF